MKTLRCLCLVIASASWLSDAQPVPGGDADPRGPTTGIPVVVEVGPHHRVWETVTVEGQGETGISSYTELATGLMYWNPEPGRWEESREEFQIAEDGSAIASRGQHGIRIAADINSPSSVTLVTPDGQRLFSNPMGVAYFDYSTGRNVLLAEVTNCVGQLVAPNQVVFAEAADTLRVALRYSYTKIGCEQDVIFYENPGSPADYGLNPETTLLEMYTEFHDPPEPEKLAATDPTGTLVDETLDFGRMRIGPGRAYFLNDDLESVDVSKTWANLNGRSFLIESVRYSAVEPMLSRMPKAQVGNSTVRDRKGLVAGLRPREKAAKVAAIQPGKMPGTPGLVLDYSTINTSQTNFTFKGSDTYYVSGTVNLTVTGTNATVIEGGTVVKFTNSSSAQINISGLLDCQTSAYRPAVFTSKDDDSVGEKITGSSGSPSGPNYGNPAILINAVNTRLHDLRVSYAQTGVFFYDPSACNSNSVTHSQFLHCNRAVQFNGYGTTFQNAAARNLLIYNCTNAFYGYSFTVDAEHLTINRCGQIAYDYNGGTYGTTSSVRLTNSLLVSITNGWGNVTVSTNKTYSSATGAGVFRTVGGAIHYLADNTYRNLGTTNLSAQLLTDLRTMTTWPPVVLTAGFTNNTVLAPQALRDTDTPDIGYHYSPLDWCWSGLNLTNATLTLTNGVAVGAYGTAGTILRNGAKFLSTGFADNLNRLVRYHTVQEQANTNWTSSATASMGLLEIPTMPSVQPEIRLRFTDLSMLAGTTSRRQLYNNSAGTSPGVLSLQHCQWRGLYLDGRCYTVYGMTVSLTNNLIQRGTLNLSQHTPSGYQNFTLNCYNNLFLRGSHTFAYNSTGTTWTVKDNLFDCDGLTAGTYAFAAGNNGYKSGLTSLGGSNNKTNVIFDYQGSGTYYYPTTGTNLYQLINAGSRTAANAGLYHFTTTTNQAKEAASTVDIGMHYVAANGSGVPVDTDGDGAGDYLEDRNGNGSTDTGETDFSVLDTDYDGRNDGQELADGTNPLNPYDVAPVRLGYWRFNSGDWKGDQGQLPLLASNLQNVASFDGNALQITNSTAILKYREVETNGNANINCHVGSIRFMYKPFWTSQGLAGGTGPGDWVQLVEMGKYTTDASVGWFSLAIDPTGTNVWISCQDNAGHSASNVVFPTANNFVFSSNVWVSLTLNYWHNGARLWVGTSQVGDLSMTNRPVPPAAVRALGFTIGSSTNGIRQARGLIDELETMNYHLSRVDQSYAPLNVMSATVTSSPPAIRLEWRSDVIQGTVLQRKLPTDSSWTSLITNSAWSYTDTNVTVNQPYEYQLFNPLGIPRQYLLSGIDLAPVDNRGKIILLVDQTLSAALTNELNQLKQDLVGDGWTVISTNVPRHIDDYSTSTSFWTNAWNITNVIKPFIVSTYNADPTNTKAIFIVGHVSIPYSGFAPDDGHGGDVPGDGNHYGAWPADIYYGDVDGIWTDSLPYPAGKYPISYLETTNIVGDGKFDQDFVPINSSGAAKVELGVGRIDFARMNVLYTGGQDETTLLRQYMNKGRRYRYKETGFASRTIVTANWNPQLPHNDFVYRNALWNGSPMFSFERGRILEGDIFSGKRSCLLGVHGGSGSPDSITGGAYTSGFFAITNVANEPPVGFYLLKGSWFGDWNLPNSFLRAVLGTTNYGLGAMWIPTTDTKWRLESFAAGETIGDCLVRTANDSSQFSSGSLRTLAIMGDPTLRLKVSAPPSGLNAMGGGGNVSLSWSPSPESNATYLVYRSTNGLTGPFVRLTSSPIVACNYTDPSPPSIPKTYQVRALNGVTTGSGTYTNASVGVFVDSN